MDRILLAFAAAAVLLGLIGCRSLPRTAVRPPIGIVYTHFTAPLQVDYHGGDLGSRKGTGQTQRIWAPNLWVDFAWGDAALMEAARDGNITTLKAADYEYLNVLFIYQEFTIHAYGD